MKKLILNLLIISLQGLCFTSCSNAGKNKEQTDNDSTSMNADPEVQKLVSLFKTELPLPFIVDSAFLVKEHYGDSIGGKEMKLLASNVMKHDQLGSLEYDLPDFYNIDSIKATGTYTAWCETLDIAMTKFSKAEAVGKIKYTDETDLLVWMLQQSSYEACPWSNFRTVYITPVHKNKIGQTSVLGESYGAGDPPVSLHRYIYGTVNKDGSIVLDWREEHDDMDTTFSELEKRKYDLLIKDDNISVMKELKEQLIKIPHPKEDQ
jgi:hypothetical protein